MTYSVYICFRAGIAMNPLVKELQQALPGQTHFRSILTDEMFRVNGSDGSIFAVGDAATIDQPKALAHADELFDQARTAEIECFLYLSWFPALRG